MNENTDSMAWLVWTGWALASTGIGWVIWKQIKKLGLTTPAATPPALQNLKPVRTEKRAGGLSSDILQEGSGPGAKNSDRLTVHYTAYLTTGEKVDSSYDRGRPFTFQLGKGTVIIGWDSALQGVKAGERRKVTVPAKLAYGSKGQNLVPPGATVVFDIEVLSIE